MYMKKHWINFLNEFRYFEGLVFDFWHMDNLVHATGNIFKQKEFNLESLGIGGLSA